MSRYYFDICNAFETIDREGVDLADLKAVRRQVRQTLPELIKEIQPSQDVAQFRVDVRDESGKRVVTSTILMVIESAKDRVDHPKVALKS